MTEALKKKRAKKQKIVVDFTPTATRVFMRRRTHTYLHLRDEDAEGLFLTMDSGTLSVVRLPIVIGEHHSVYRVWFNREDYEDLEPFAYDFVEAVRKYHTSLLGRTAGAEREMRAILGLPELEESVTDADLAAKPVERKRSRKEPSVASEKPAGGYTLQALCAELGIDPTDARKHLRQQKVEKPGGRWEWASAEAAAPVRTLLEAMPKE
jgi:hypothetical protein